MLTGYLGMIIDISSGKAYTTEASDYNLFFEPTKRNLAANEMQNNQGNPPLAPLLSVPLSDVDTNIPIRQGPNNKAINTFVAIIANEDYKSESKVPFAVRDGEIFKEYCIKTLGISEANIDFF